MSLYIDTDVDGEPSVWESVPNGDDVPLVRRIDLYDRSCAHWLGAAEARRRQFIVWNLITKAVGDQT